MQSIKRKYLFHLFQCLNCPLPSPLSKFSTMKLVHELSFTFDNKRLLEGHGRKLYKYISRADLQRVTVSLLL